MNNDYCDYYDYSAKHSDHSFFNFYKGNVQNSTILEPISTNKPNLHMSSSSKNTTYPKSINDSFKILNAKPDTRGLYFDYFYVKYIYKKTKRQVIDLKKSQSHEINEKILLLN